MTAHNSKMRGPRSLAEQAMAVALENIEAVESLGDLPLRYLSILLRAVKSATQLRNLELNSGDIYDETKEHWKRLISKDFPLLSAKYNYVPKDPKSWHKVYDKYKKIQEKQDAEATEKLMQSFAAHKQEKDSRRTTILTTQQTKKLPSHKKIIRPRLNGLPAPPREKPTFFQKAKIEAAAGDKRFLRLAATGKLPTGVGQIQKAPEMMVTELRIASLPDPSAGQGYSVGQPAKTQSKFDQELKEKERRLADIKKSAAKESPVPNDSGVAPNVVSFSDDEDDGDQAQAVKPSSTSFSKSTPATVPSKDATKRRRGGLLSAAPGANKIKAVRASPASPAPKAPAETKQPEKLAAAPNRAAALSTSPPPPAEPSAAPVVHFKRKNPADSIFRQVKRARH
ncbi:hypothetical protein VTK26DRAFT_5261 [Humicola hyalothermophila]